MRTKFQNLKQYLVVVFSILIFALTPTISNAGKVEVPGNIEGTTKVNAEQLINLINEFPDLVVIDSRMGDRHEGYIEGSISLPDIDTTCDSLAKNINSKSTPIAFYCNGVKCGRSVVAARTAIKCGYNKIYWFRGGFIEWKSNGYPYKGTKG